MNIKNIFILIILSALVFSSCEDLDEGAKGAISANSFYADELSLDAGVTGLYGSLHRGVWGVDILAAYTGAEDLTTHSAGNKDVFREGDQFALSGSNSRLSGIWSTYYYTINACNEFINNANPEIEIETINKYKADAHFLRGLLYFRLVTIFGDIPMPLGGNPDLEMEKTAKREIFTQIISDLEFAAQWCDNPRDDDPAVLDGHATQAAAKAFLAKTYMQLTGYPYNETEHWSTVKTYAKEIIDGGKYSLMDLYSDNFEEPGQNNGNNEIIWAHTFKRNSWPSITESRWYGAFWLGWMDMYLEWKFYNDMPEGFRKSYCATDTSQYARQYDHPVLRKLIYGAVIGQPEYVHTFRTHNDMPAMRYAEVLLMYAEASAQAGETSEALEALNKVRRRAYASGSTSKDEVLALGAKFWETADATIDYKAADFATAEALVDAISKERAFEFVAEVGGNRWLDLVRLEKVEEANQNRDARELPFIGSPSDKSTWFAPIPETEVKLNPNLANDL